MLNSSGTQDLVVHVLAKDKRFVVANYPSVTIPTNLDVSEAARGSFPAFYAALLDRTLEKTPGAIVTEYAWPSSSCDPCPGGVSGLSATDLATLGADIVASSPAAQPTQPSGLAGLSNSGGSGSGGLPVGLSPRVSAPTIRQGAITVNGSLPPEVIQRIVRQNFARYRLCYENGLRSNPNLAGRVTVKFEIGGTGAVTSATDGGSTLADKSVVDCVLHGFRNFSFPEPERKVPVAVVYPLDFAPGSSMPPGGGRFGSGPFASYVLTRLHARYAKDALGSDLVFKEAPPIVGGREMRGESGALETGSVAAPTSAFQARYAIRHEWKGALACKEPRRGVWGRPWADAGASDSSPVAAQKLAYAPRGNLSLAAFVPGGVPELTMTAGAGAGASPAASAAKAPSSVPGADAGGPPPAVPASRCGCRVVGSSGGGPSMLLLAAGVAFAVVRRRRGLARA